MAQETFGVGLRAARTFKLNTGGTVDGSLSAGATGYAGVNVGGIREIQLNIPQNQRIQHVGQDQVQAQDFLPPTELPSGTFVTDRANQKVDIVFNSQKIHTIDDMEIDGLFTDKQGFENDVMIQFWRQALNAEASESQSRRWQNYFVLNTRVTPQGNSPTQGGADENSYDMTPTYGRTYPWLQGFSESNNGFTETVRIRIFSEYPRMFEQYEADGTLDTFNTHWTPISTAKTKVWGSDGSALTVSSVDTGNKTYTLNSAPSAGKIFALYETTDSIRTASTD